MRVILFGLMFLTIACSSPVSEPKNLIPEDKMAELIADLTISDQMSAFNQNGNMETQTIFILKKYGVTSRQYAASYQYYLAAPSKITKIYDNAQKIIKDKDPAASQYIQKKLKETKATPKVAQ